MVSEIAPERLADRLDRGEQFTLVDTRPAESYRAWHVQGARNYPFSPGDAVDPDEIAAILDGDELLTICARGVSSFEFAEQLDSLGYEVGVVAGGMAAWSQLYETVRFPVGDEVEVVQVQRRAKGCLGYVVGCRTTGEAAVVDATRHTDEFARAADDAGYAVTHVLDTHVHADHIAGGRRLADEHGVPYHLGDRAAERGVEYEYDALGRNEVLAVGELDLKAVPTPGHTSEMTSYLVDAAAVLTGDTLFVDAIGRTELEFGDESAAEGARLLYDSLHRTLLAEPDSVTVLPGHVAVTADGRWEHAAPGEPVRATIGGLRRELEVLQLDADAFVERVAANVPEKPPNYETVIGVNRGVEPLPDDAAATELELGPNRCAAG